MCKSKKFLSITLSLSMIFNLVLSTKTFAYEPGFDVDSYLSEHCSERNSKGGYLRQGCAGIEAQKILLSGEKDYVIMKDLGSLGEYTFYYFNFKVLDKILDEVGLDKTEDKLSKKIDQLLRERKSDFAKEKVIYSIGLSSLVSAVSGNLLFKSLDERSKHKKDINSVGKYILNMGVGMARFVSALCGGSLASIFLGIKHRLASKKIYDLCKKANDVNELNIDKACALNCLLSHIENLDYSNEDFFVIKSYPNRCWEFDSGNMSLNFTEEEKAKLPEKMEKLAKDIEENLGRRLHRD